MAKVKTKYQCEKCLNWFSARGGNYQRHIKACDGNFKKSLNGICPYCNENVGTGVNVIQNHVQYCKENPDCEKLQEMRKNVPQLNTPEAWEKKKKGISEAWDRGCYDNVDQGVSFRGKTWEEVVGKEKAKEALGKISKYATKKLIELQEKGGQSGFVPRVNLGSIPYIEELSDELGIEDLQHGLNGGEKFIPKPNGKGFYAVDGYSKEKNIVIEYQEKEHQKLNKVKEDREKREWIIESLNMNPKDYHYIWEK